MGRNIDAYGKDAVLERFRFYMDNLSDKGQDLVYTIWAQGKLKWPSRETDLDAAVSEFGTMLEGWEQAGTTGDMEVRFHPAKNGSPKAKSDYLGSFIFKLTSPDPNVRYERLDAQVAGTAGNVLPSGRSSIQQLITDIEALEKLKGILNPPGEIGALPDGPKTVLDKIEQVLTIPIVEDFIAGLANRMGMDINSKHGAQMAGDETVMYMRDEMSTDAVSHLTDLSSEEEERLRMALERLMKGEKDFVGLMERLADLKDKNPLKYSAAKSFL